MITIRNGKYVRIPATRWHFVTYPLSAHLRNFIDPKLSRYEHNAAVDVLWKRIEKEFGLDKRDTYMYNNTHV